MLSLCPARYESSLLLYKDNWEKAFRWRWTSSINCTKPMDIQNQLDMHVFSACEHVGM